MGLGIPAPLACALQGYLKEPMTKNLSLRTMWLAHCLRSHRAGVKPLSARHFAQTAWDIVRCS